uniref:uncharacterized protein LOC120331673 n=1 Tax=Styela clava TaxID=7725 RepID=UPI00193A7D46|nr:uncharacterized protein LOC120331673 [Styela clava]
MFNQTYLRNLHHIIRKYEYAAQNNEENYIIDIKSLEPIDDTFEDYENRVKLTDEQKFELEGLHNVTINEMKEDFFNIPGEDFPVVSDDMSVYSLSVLNTANALLLEGTDFTSSSDNGVPTGSIPDAFKDANIVALDKNGNELSIILDDNSTMERKMNQSVRSQNAMEDAETSIDEMSETLDKCESSLEKFLQNKKNETQKRKQSVSLNSPSKVAKNETQSPSSPAHVYASESEISLNEDPFKTILSSSNTNLSSSSHLINTVSDKSQKESCYKSQKGRIRLPTKGILSEANIPTDDILCSPIRRIKLASPVSRGSGFTRIPALDTRQGGSRNLLYDPMQSEDDSSVEDFPS